MKKLAIAATLTAVSCTVFAQSSVTLFGIADEALTHGVGSVAHLNALTSGANSSSRLGFRGTEDLGSGLAAGFWLEAGVTPDTGNGQPSNSNNQTTGAGVAGSLSFNRRATVSLSGNFGELRLGRDYAASTINRFTYEAFGNVGVGSSQAYAGMLGSLLYRVSNSVMYFLPPNLGGVYGEAQAYFGENASNAGAIKNDGNGQGLRLGWRSGPFDISASQGKTKYARTATAGDITVSTLGARYDFDAFSVMGGYYRDKVETIAGVTGHGGQIAGLYRLGAGEFKAQYSNYETSAVGQPEAKKISLGYVYSLSKRTALYTTLARVKNSGGSTAAVGGSITAANRSSSGIDLGIRHAF